jgi:hypothetical protein
VSAHFNEINNNGLGVYQQNELSLFQEKASPEGATMSERATSELDRACASVDQ